MYNWKDTGKFANSERSTSAKVAFNVFIYHHAEMINPSSEE